MSELYTKLRHTILPIVVACLPLGPFGCNRDATDDAQSEGSAALSPAVPVEYARPSRAEMARAVAASTTIESAQNASVQSRAAGRLTNFSLRVGDSVETGALIGRVDAPEVGLTIDEAQRAVERAQAALDDLRPLFEQGYVARRVYEDAHGALEQARTGAERAGQARSDLTIVAPESGVVTEVLAHNGELVMPNQTIARLVSLAHLEARAAIPERDATQIQVGMPATITVADPAAPPVIARVERIAPVVNARTGTTDITILPVAADSTLRPGMFVTAHIVVDTHSNALVLPKRALLWEADRAYAFVIVPGEGSGAEATVERRWLRLGYEDARRAEVLDGIGDDDLVVVTGQTGLESGDRVELVLERTDLLAETESP